MKVAIKFSTSSFLRDDPPLQNECEHVLIEAINQLHGMLHREELNTFPLHDDSGNVVGFIKLSEEDEN